MIARFKAIGLELMGQSPAQLRREEALRAENERRARVVAEKRRRRADEERHDFEREQDLVRRGLAEPWAPGLTTLATLLVDGYYVSAPASAEVLHRAARLRLSDRGLLTYYTRDVPTPTVPRHLRHTSLGQWWEDGLVAERDGAERIVFTISHVGGTPPTRAPRLGVEVLTLWSTPGYSHDTIALPRDERLLRPTLVVRWEDVEPRVMP